MIRRRFGCEINQGIKSYRGKNLVDNLAVTSIAVHELVSRIGRQTGKAFGVDRAVSLSIGSNFIHDMFGSCEDVEILNFEILRRLL